MRLKEALAVVLPKSWMEVPRNTDEDRIRQWAGRLTMPIECNRCAVARGYVLALAHAGLTGSGGEARVEKVRVPARREDWDRVRVSKGGISKGWGRVVDGELDRTGHGCMRGQGRLEISTGWR